ncbi:MAG: UDP-N-acetylmuramyl-tripeptide synthetase [Sphaerochaetaceae bacterium]
MKRLAVLWTNNKVRRECTIRGEGDPLVEGISFSAQDCRANFVYIAIHGLHHDGHSFIDEALRRGASVVVHHQILKDYQGGIKYIRHPNPRRIASLFASTLYGELPSTIIGVTGTDGKSTTCDFLWQLLTFSGVQCGLLTTVAIDDGRGKRESPYRQSTPESPQIYHFLAECKKNGVETVLLEATSHGLSTKASRLVDIVFSGAIVTAFSSEHLEYHENLENYLEAKLNIVRQLKVGGWLVINQAIPFFERFVRDGIKIIPYNRGSLKTVAQQWDKRVIEVAAKTRITLPYGQECYALNATGAYLALQALGPVGRDEWHLLPVKGRFEVVTTTPFLIIIDFAHTKEAFDLLFKHLKDHFPEKRLVALFGSGGERDRTKRFALGSSAATWCHTLFLTDEDPRYEEPLQIESDIVAGINSVTFEGELFKIYGRAEAIKAALNYCDPSTILLLLGKGHESSLEYKGEKLPWNERALVERLLAEKGAK